MIALRGITWNHERGIMPLVHASSVFQQKHNGVNLSWDARSLADFERFPLEQLADRYDLIMIDHPHLGSASAERLLAPLDELIPAAFLDEQQANSVGPSHRSYCWEGRQWALAVDAAAQVSAYRSDLLESAGLALPQTWDQVRALAKALPSSTAIGLPFVPVHAFASYFTVTAQLGGEAFWSKEEDIPRPVGIEAINLLRTILKEAHPLSVHGDPIAMYERMSTTDEVAYVPLMYGYSNYSRAGFRPKTVYCGNIPSDTGEPAGSMIGGVGLAISAKCPYPDLAAKFAMMTAEASFQRSDYFANGGQPGHRSAWKDAVVNEQSSGFFANTLRTLDLGSVRPRFNGYIPFQEEAGELIRQAVVDPREDERETVHRLNKLIHRYRPSQACRRS
ncbi:extracellular solute-binding protein [Paenibacillus sp. HB172176]|uniref:ABC transporter substrate-binding protein n=1 Tax=Paenibacillus sp. HB172176 TaxID=2493690 RepID=UPI00143BF041|nr:extracellular solute-binding protein [Paenibacillus sp. HB172176]